MKKEIMKVSRGEMNAVDDHVKKMERQNAKIVALRKKQVYMALKEATVSRLEANKNIQHWIKMLSNKIFDPDTIEEMNIDKAIALFKYVNNINLKVLSESNRLEEILTKYIESGMMDTASKISGEGAINEEREKIKHEIFSKLNKVLKDSSEETQPIVVDKEENTLTDEEAEELEIAEQNLDDNLAAIDESMDVDLDEGLDED